MYAEFFKHVDTTSYRTVTCYKSLPGYEALGSKSVRVEDIVKNLIKYSFKNFFVVYVM
jgi:hypothetical protein